MTNLFSFYAASALSLKSGADAFVCKTIPAELLDRITQLQPQTAANRRKALFLTTAFGLSMLTMILIPLGIVVLNCSFADVLRTAPWVYAIAGTAVVVWVSILLYALQYRKRSRSLSPYGAQTSAENRLIAECKTALGIPEDATVVDVLAEVLTMKKDGTLRHKAHTLTGVPLYHNLPTPVFADDAALYLSDFTRLIKIPLSSLRGVTRSKRRVALYNWNKNASPCAEPYRRFRLRRSIHVHTYYYQIEIHDPMGTFCLLIPDYDAEAFMETAHLQLQSDD